MDKHSIVALEALAESLESRARLVRRMIQNARVGRPLHDGLEALP